MARCQRCNRSIGLSKSGQFRRHVSRLRYLGEVCQGSWEYPHEQQERIRQEEAERQKATHAPEGLA